MGSLFSGIGGIDLGLKRAGMEIRWQVENDLYCQRVLEKHWPGVRRYGDIKTVDPGELERVDLVAGGFPCQPVSVAGSRLGTADARWLWPEFARILRGVRPQFVFVENVPGLLVRHMGDVLGDLAELGYDAEWQSLPASAVGAPHLRWRVWILAYPRCAEWGASGEGYQPDREDAEGQAAGRSPEASPDGRTRTLAYPQCDPIRHQSGRRNGESGASTPIVGDDGATESLAHAARDRWSPQGEWATARYLDGGGELPRRSTHWDTEPSVGRVADGISNRLDRLRGLGNAVIPQIVEWVGRRILAAEETARAPQGDR